MRVDVHACQRRSPGDITETARLLDDGVVSPDDVVALVGRSDGSRLGQITGGETPHPAITELLADRLEASVEDAVIVRPPS